MNLIAPGLLVLSGFLLNGCGDSEHGRYQPVSANNSIFLVDTQTGKMYDLPVQYRQGSDPKNPPPAKWKLVAEF